MQAVLVVDCSATGIRFAAFDGTAPGELSLIGKGPVLRCGDDIEFFARSAVSSHPEILRSRAADDGFDHGKAMSRMLRWIGQYRGVKIVAVGHCAKHGDRRYPWSMLLTDSMVDDLEAANRSEQAHHLKAMRLLRERLPSIPQVACFDSASRGSALQLVHRDASMDESSTDRRMLQTDRDKAIAADTLRCIERSPTSAVIHAFPASMPESQRDLPSKLALTA